MKKKKIVIISGPTASGKSDLAVKIAKEFNGEIISCDSMQIYKYLDIGTAKICDTEMDSIPHYMLNIINPDEEFSVEQYVGMAREKIDQIISRGKLPIVVGGTCLYIKSLINPYSFCSSPKDEKIRKFYNDFLEKNGKEKLFEILRIKDFEASQRIHQNDTKRVIRALEICDTTNETKTKLNINDSKEEFYDYAFVVINCDRNKLYERINARVDKMFDLGLVDEFNANLKRFNLSKNCQSMQAIGYKELFLLNENSDEKQVKELIKQHTRNYAKRQLTFLRSFKDAKWFDTDKNISELFDFVQNKLGLKRNKNDWDKRKNKNCRKRTSKRFF